MSVDADDEKTALPQPTHGSAAEVFGAYLALGLTSFGGPVAHLGYFHEAFVVRRKWIGEAAYADLVALCQFLPGPASSQVGMAIGLRRAGYAGMLAAWLAFTLPSALLILGVLPFWEGLRSAPLARRALLGVDAAVVGLLAAALYDPIFTAGITSAKAMAIAAAAFVALAAWKATPWAVVVASGVAGFLVL